MKTVSDIIKELGGTTFVARSLDLAPSTVSAWRSRKHIPIAYWNRLVLVSPERVGVVHLLAAHITENKS